MARERIERAQRRLRELRERRAQSATGAPASGESAEADAEAPESGADSSAARPEPVEPAEPASEPSPEALDQGPEPLEPSPGPPEPPQAEVAHRGDEQPRESLAGRLQALRGGDEPQAADADQEGPADSGARSTGAGSASGRQRVSDAWSTFSQTTRARIAAFLILAALAVLVIVLVDSGDPCEDPGGEACSDGADGAIALVPGDALAYAHIDADPESDQLEAASELSASVPLLSRLAISAVSDVGGTKVDYDVDIRPWTGGEMALALLPGNGQLERVVMIEAADEAGAQEFADGLLGPNPTERQAGDVQLSVGKRGLAAGMLDGFLMIGDESSLASIAEGDGRGEGEALDDSAATALAELPESRLAYGYVSATGARVLLAGDPSLSSLDTFVDADASDGAAASLSVEDGSLDLAVRSVLDPDRAEASPSFFAALPQFEPGLNAELSPDALAYLGLGDPASSIESLLAQAAASAPDLLAAFNRVEEDLRREGGISITEDLLPLLGSEAAVAVEPVAGKADSGTPGVLASSGVPYLSLVADGVDTGAAAKSLANLQAPLIDALAPVSSGKVPAFEEAEIAGVVAQSLTINPDVELTYATFEDRLVVATNPLGIEQARADGEGLASSEAFDAATANLPDEVSLIAYFNLQDLLAIGERLGLAEDPGGATFARALRNLDAAAIAIDGSGETLRTDLRVTVGEPEAAASDAPPLSGE